MINTRLVLTSIIISCVISAVLIIFPDLDLAFSKIFYSNEQGFIYRNNPLITFLFSAIPIFTKILFIISLAYIVYLAYRYKRIKSIILSWSFYIIVTSAIGPGLIVNYVLKENFGRARPVQINNFNGNKNFSRAFFISDQCAHNCSFASGHAAMGYYFTSLAYILPAIYFSKTYLMVLLFGSLVGFSRILMGGHFLSDITASCFIILSINHILYLCWYKLKSRLHIVSRTKQ